MVRLSIRSKAREPGTLVLCDRLQRTRWLHRLVPGPLRSIAKEILCDSFAVSLRTRPLRRDSMERLKLSRLLHLPEHFPNRNRHRPFRPRAAIARYKAKL